MFAAIATAFHMFVLLGYTEVVRFSHEIWDILARFWKKLIELATEWLWPWVARLLEMINVESIKLLYNDIQKGMPSEKCLHAFVERSGWLEYVFIVGISLLIMASVFRITVIPVRNYVLGSKLMQIAHDAYPLLFNLCFYVLLFTGSYFAHFGMGYVLRWMGAIVKIKA
jgi:hypothetical protein